MCVWTFECYPLAADTLEACLFSAVVSSPISSSRRRSLIVSRFALRITFLAPTAIKCYSRDLKIVKITHISKPTVVVIESTKTQSYHYTQLICWAITNSISPEDQVSIHTRRCERRPNNRSLSHPKNTQRQWSRRRRIGGAELVLILVWCFF